MNLRIYTVNAGEQFPIKNGSGGGAPAKEEDARFPMANINIESRYRFWRTSTAPPNPTLVDYDLTASLSVSSFGLSNIRSYRGTAGITSLEVEYSTSAYLPGAWTQILPPQAIATTDNDVMFDVTPTNMRSVRFKIANAGQFSCKLWMVLNANKTDLQEGFDMEETSRRIRAPEYKTLLGAVGFNDLGVGKAAVIKSWKFKETCSLAQRNALLALQTKTLMFRDRDGKHYEVTPGSPVIRWRASGVVITTRSEVEADLEQVP